MVPHVCQFPRHRRVKLVTRRTNTTTRGAGYVVAPGYGRISADYATPGSREVVLTADSENQRRTREYEREVSELHEQTKLLEEEVVNLRRRLQNAPKRVSTLEEKLLETKGQLAQAISQNEKLTYTLREAREHIATLREEVEKLTQPPSAYGTFLGINDDGTADVFSAGRKMRVALHPELEEIDLKRGQEVVLNESLNVILARNPELSGEVVVLKELLEDGKRALIVGRADEERVVELSEDLVGVKIRSGDTILMDSRTGLLLERLQRPEIEDLILEEVPDITYDGRRRSRQPDRSDHRRGRAAVSCTASCSSSTSCRRPRASCCTARRAAGRRSSPRRWPTRWRRRSLSRPATRRRAATSSTSRARSCSTSTSARPSAKSGWSSSGRGKSQKKACPSSSSSTRWIRCSARAAPASAPTWSRRSCRSCWPRSTVSRRCETSSSLARRTGRNSSTRPSCGPVALT